MSMMKSQILKFVDFTKTQKSRYLENETLFFLQIKKFILHIKGYFIFMAKKYFCRGEIFFSYFKLNFSFFNVKEHMAVSFVVLAEGGSCVGHLHFFCLHWITFLSILSHNSLILLIFWNIPCYLHFAFCLFV